MFERQLNRINFRQFLDLFLSMLESSLKLPVVLKSLKEDSSTSFYASKILIEMEKNNSFSHALCTVCKEIKSYESMLQMAEETGDIVPVLKNITSDLKEKNENIKNFVITALYPAFIILLALGLSFILYFIGVPYIAEISEISQEELKGGIIKANVWLVISVLLLFVFIKWKMETNDFQYRFFRNLYYLVLNSVGIEAALQFMIKTNGFSLKEKKTVMQVLDGIRKGEELNLICKKIQKFDVFTLTWLSASKNTGNVQKSFHKIFEYYNDKRKENKEIVMRFVEPAVFLISGVYILILIIYCIVPIFLNLGSTLL